MTLGFGFDYFSINFCCNRIKEMVKFISNFVFFSYKCMIYFQTAWCKNLGCAKSKANFIPCHILKDFIYFLEKDSKACVCFFYQIFIFHQMIALQKLWKMFFISSKNLFSFLQYSNFCIFVLSSHFFPISHCFKGWFKKNLKVYDIIQCLHNNLITHYV